MAKASRGLSKITMRKRIQNNSDTAALGLITSRGLKFLALKASIQGSSKDVRMS